MDHGEVVVEDTPEALKSSIGTDRIALIQRRLAALLADAAGVRVLECPWDVVPLKQSLWWHPIYRADPGHRWLRGLVARVGEQINGSPAA